jgi:hypothetical protein
MAVNMGEHDVFVRFMFTFPIEFGGLVPMEGGFSGELLGGEKFVEDLLRAEDAPSASPVVPDSAGLPVRREAPTVFHLLGIVLDVGLEAKDAVDLRDGVTAVDASSAVTASPIMGKNVHVRFLSACVSYGRVTWERWVSIPNVFPVFE